MLGSLMGYFFEALVIDNNLLDIVKRVIRGIEVTEETLSVNVIKDIVLGGMNYRRYAQTLERMQSEFLYTKIVDLPPPRVCEEEGSKDILERAHEIAF